MWVLYMIFEWLSGRRDAERQARLYAREKQKLEERAERREELERLIREDSKELIDTLRLWFNPPDIGHIRISTGETILKYHLSFASVIYQVDGKTKPMINNLQEPWWLDARLVERIKEHLLNSDWNLWIKAKEAVDTHLEKIKGLWESIEDTLRSELIHNCPSMTEWYPYRENPPAEYYNMNFCLDYVWSEVERTVRFNTTPSFYQLRENPEDANKVGIGYPYAYSPNPVTRAHFIETIKSVVSTFQTKFQTIYDELHSVEDTVKEFGKVIEQRIYDFDHPPYYNLPNTCNRCRLSYEELERLKSSG
jgi:hypothetical protein